MTLGHEKKQGDYTLGQIMHGMDDRRNGGRICEGTGLSESTFFRAKKTLQKRGLITAKTHGQAGWVFEVNPDWSPTGPNVIHEGNVATIHPCSRLKKRRPPGFSSAEGSGNDPVEDATRAVNLTVGNSQIDGHPIIDTSQAETLPLHSEVVAPPPASRSSLPVKKQEDFTGEEKDENPMPPKAPLCPAPPQAEAARPLSGDTLYRAWKVAWVEGQASGNILPTCISPEWSPRDKRAMKQIAVRWNERAHGPFTDFVAYAVTNWKAIMRAKFSWMHKDPPPSLPSVQFFTNRNFFNEIVEAYCDRESVKWAGTQKGTAREVAHAMNSGLSREAAILEVAKAQALLIDRKQRESDIAAARLMYSAAELALARAAKVTATRQRYEAQPRNVPENFAPSYDRPACAPIAIEHADFSGWELD